MKPGLLQADTREQMATTACPDLSLLISPGSQSARGSEGMVGEDDNNLETSFQNTRCLGKYSCYLWATDSGFNLLRSPVESHFYTLT